MNDLFSLVFFGLCGLLLLFVPYWIYTDAKAEKDKERERAVRESTKACLADVYMILCGEEPYKCVPFLRLLVLLQTFQLGLRDESELFVGDVMAEVLTDSKREEKLCELVEVSRQLYENSNLSEIDPDKLEGLKIFISLWLGGLRAMK